MNESLRQTGRTTRMVEQALELAQRGHAVYLLIPRAMHPHWWRRICDVWADRNGGLRGHGIQLEAPDSPAFSFDFDWQSLRIRHAHPNTVVLVDHAFVEQRIERLQREIAAAQAEISRLHPLTF